MEEGVYNINEGTYSRRKKRERERRIKKKGNGDINLSVSRLFSSRATGDKPWLSD